jgi:hypothetical protein
VRFDPTAAVAPQRIEAGLDAALPGGATGDLPLASGQRLLDAVALRWDALNATWDQFVLAFGPEQQAELLERVGWRAPTARDIALACAATTSLVLMLFTAVRLGRPRPPRDPLARAWRELTRKLSRRVRPPGAQETPAEYAAAIRGLRPELARVAQPLVDRYLELRYDATPSPHEVDALLRAIRRFRPR